jgi:hypothetical protein
MCFDNVVLQDLSNDNINDSCHIKYYLREKTGE